MIKKMVFYTIVFLFLSMTGLLGAHEEHFVPHYMKTEKQLRRELYQAYESNPYFYKSTLCKFFKDTDFYILTLKAHVQKLQKKIAEQRPVWHLKSLYKAIGWSGLSVLSGAATYGLTMVCKVPKREHYRSYSAHQGALQAYVFSIFVTMFTCCFSGVESYNSFNKAFNHVQRQLDHVQRDKQLLAIFEMEKRKQAEKEAVKV